MDPEKLSDPRTLGGDIAGPGGPHDRDAVVVDMTNSVLLDGVDVTAVLPKRGEEWGNTAIAMLMEGRINKTQDRARVLFVFDEDGAAGILTQLFGLANRVSPEFLANLMALVEQRLKEME